MGTHRITRRYKSGLGVFSEGDVVDLDDELAAHLERDSPGLLAGVDSAPAEPDPETEPDGEVEDEAEREKKPPRDRQARTPRNRGGS